MNARELYQQGQLDEAIAGLIAQVKAAPASLEHRTFLFELLSFAGDWPRAIKQLDAIGHLQDSTTGTLGVQVYRNLVDHELVRDRLYSAGVRPRFALEPSQEVRLRLEALEALRRGQAEQSSQLVQEAESVRVARPGTMGGKPFDDVRDGDDFLASALEVFTTAGYFWIPWEQIQLLEVAQPTHLRDLIWLPAKLATHDGQLGEVYLANLYPGSAQHGDRAVRLGRKTEWLEPAPGLYQGVGQKVFLVGDESLSLPEMAVIQLPAPTDEETR